MKNFTENMKILTYYLTLNSRDYNEPDMYKDSPLNTDQKSPVAEFIGN